LGLREALRVLGGNVSFPRENESITEKYQKNTGNLPEKFKEGSLSLKQTFGH